MPANTPLIVKIKPEKSKSINVVCNHSGVPVQTPETGHYLAYHKTTQRYYIGRTDPKIYLGKDLEQAINKYNIYVSDIKSEGGIVISETPPIPTEELSEKINQVFFPKGQEIEITVNPDGSISSQTQIDQHVIWKIIKAQVDADLEKFKDDFLRWVGYYIDISIKKPQSVNLSAVINRYLADKQITMTKKEFKQSETWWSEFVEITGAITARELSIEKWRRYRDTIKERQQKEDKKATFTRNRFGKIKTVIRWYLSEEEVNEKDNHNLSLFSILKAPTKETPSPTFITKQEMKKIMKTATDIEKAIILLALNAAYTNIDIQRAKWSMIDFSEQTIRHDRIKSQKLTKKPVSRIALLWERTIKQLQKLPQTNDTIFLSIQKKPMHIDTIYDHFKNAVERAGIKRNITFKHIRSSALTAASNTPDVPDRQIDLLAGHSAGIKEHYVVKKNVKLACEAIEQAYFGKE